MLADDSKEGIFHRVWNFIRAYNRFISDYSMLIMYLNCIVDILTIYQNCIVNIALG